jgi:hypothetical protein
MASNINATQIDETYPIAGQDNDTQGFRDNFNYIKVGLTTAASEITALQANTAGLNLTNLTDQFDQSLGSDFGGKLISNAVTKDNTSSLISGGLTVATALNIVYANGDYQVYSADRNIAVDFINGFSSPSQSNGMAKMYLEIRGTETGPFNISFFTNGSYSLKYETGFSGTVSVANNQHAIFEIIHRHRSDAVGFLEKTIFVKLVGIFE